MARILSASDKHWYDELKAVAYYRESEVERWILQHATSLFPDHFVFRFKKDITSHSTGTKKRPDLALIRRDLTDWTIVEVEIEGHSVEHVLDQIKVFTDGDYNAPEITEYAQGRLKTVCKTIVGLRKLRKLFSSHAPSVLVITDSHMQELQKELSKIDVSFCVFEVYKNAVGHYVYRTFGEYPTVSAQEAHCRPHKSLPNVVEVIGPFAFKRFRRGKQVEVAYDEYLTLWEVMVDGGKQYLRFMGTLNPLNPNVTYGLFRDGSHKYYFRRS